MSFIRKPLADGHRFSVYFEMEREQISCTSQRCPSLQHAADVLKHLQTTKEKQNHTRHLSNQFALILSVLSILFLIFSSFLVFIHLLQEMDLRTAWDWVRNRKAHWLMEASMKVANSGKSGSASNSKPRSSKLDMWSCRSCANTLMIHLAAASLSSWLRRLTIPWCFHWGWRL